MNLVNAFFSLATGIITSIAFPVACAEPHSCSKVRISIPVVLSSTNDGNICHYKDHKNDDDNTLTVTTIRSIDGTDRDDQLGATHTPLRRVAPAFYADQMGEMMTTDRPNPRSISNAVSAQNQDGDSAVNNNNHRGLSDMIWAWGQFVDHDMDLTEGSSHFGAAGFAIPQDDPDDIFVQQQCDWIDMTRSEYIQGSDGVREQVNLITSFIDASNVYGSDAVRADALRDNDIRYLLATSDNGQMPPFNTMGLDNAGGHSDASLYLVGTSIFLGRTLVFARRIASN